MKKKLKIIFLAPGTSSHSYKWIDFFSKKGLNYISCSPFRVPVARLAAAQAELRK